MSRPGFVRIPRTNGEPAVVRADMITAMLPQKVKEKGSGAEVDEVTMQVGQTCIIHTPLSVEQIAKMVLSATGMPMTIVEPV